MTFPAVWSRSTDSEQVVIHTVTQCMTTCQHQQSWRSRTWPRR